MKQIHILIVLATLWIGHATQAQMRGDGGAGVVQDGKFMTFYSAQIKVKGSNDPFAVQEGLAFVPGLKEVTNFIVSYPWLPGMHRSGLIKSLIPTKNRHYYNIDEKWFGNENRERVLQQFEDATGLPVTKMRLFAVTDQNSGDTFLFPEFYQLSPIDKQAALFHEGYWLYDNGHSNHRLSYEKIIKIENAFQAVLTHPKSVDIAIKLLAEMGDLYSAMIIGFYLDFQSGVINKDGFIVNGPLKMAFTSNMLYGSAYKNCIISGGDCDSLFLQNLQNLKLQFPSSIFLKAVFAKCYSHCRDLQSNYINDEPLGLIEQVDGDDDVPVLVPGLRKFDDIQQALDRDKLEFGYLMESSLFGDYSLDEVIEVAR